MGKEYKPPFTITENITNQVIEIGELVGRIAEKERLSTNPKLRRINRIKSIYSSLAIEQNTLTMEQVTDIIGGKRVLAPPQDIREVKNAYEAYQQLSRMDPYSIEDLLEAHKYMMETLIDEAGIFRSKGVGVYDGDHLIHAGTPPQYIPELIQDLFGWLKSSKLHPLIKSCVFHYEFEFIHPFKDGNGRTGRLWHSLILQKWHPFFAWLPIETLIYEHQTDYYYALNKANTQGEATAFVTFMLDVIYTALKELADGQDKKQSTNEEVISLMEKFPKITLDELSKELEISKRQIERIVSKLKEEGKIKRTGARKNGAWKVL